MLISDYFHENAWIIKPETTIKEVIKIMVEKDCNSLVVADKIKKIVGIISLQDIAAAIVPVEFVENTNMAKAMYKHGFFDEQCQKIQDQKVETIMRTEFTSVELTSNTLAILADFLNYDLYKVPVMKDGKLVGVVTRSDMKKAFAKALNIDYSNN
jgi:predicted transcriptional regulator